MARQIKVRASNPGYLGRWRVGRHWLNGQEYLLNVSDDAKLGPNEPESAPGVPSMTEISMAGVAGLEHDPLISVLKTDDGKVTELSAKAGSLEAEVEQVKREALAEIGRLRDIIAEGNERITGLEAGNVALKDRCVELEGQLAAATKPPETKPAEDAKAPEVKPAETKPEKTDKGKAKA